MVCAVRTKDSASKKNPGDVLKKLLLVKNSTMNMLKMTASGCTMLVIIQRNNASEAPVNREPDSVRGAERTPLKIAGLWSRRCCISTGDIIMAFITYFLGCQRVHQI